MNNTKKPKVMIIPILKILENMILTVLIQNFDILYRIIRFDVKVVLKMMKNIYKCLKFIK